jgi:predicted NAD/FAD-binding protein
VSNRRVAVIGGGVAGLSAAAALTESCAGTHLDSRTRLGGNARTQSIDGTPVDVGFVAFNMVTYPRVTQLFERMGLPTVATQSETATVCEDCGHHEVVSSSPENANSPWHATELRRFAELLRLAPPSATLGEVLDSDPSLTDAFVRHCVVPRFGPWFLLSRSRLVEIGATFFYGLISELAMPNVASAWRYLPQGSTQYVARLAASIGDVRLDNPVSSVRQVAAGVQVRTPEATELFDRVIVATPPDIARRIVEAIDPRVRTALERFDVVQTRVVVHSDESIVPEFGRDRSLTLTAACRTTRGDEFRDVHVNLSRMYQFPSGTTYFKTFNPSTRPDPSKIVTDDSFSTSALSRTALESAAVISELSHPTIGFAGAYLGTGFHEAGFEAGLRAAERVASGLSEPASRVPGTGTQ